MKKDKSNIVNIEDLKKPKVIRTDAIISIVWQSVIFLLGMHLKDYPKDNFDKFIGRCEESSIGLGFPEDKYKPLVEAIQEVYSSCNKKTEGDTDKIPSETP